MLNNVIIYESGAALAWLHKHPFDKTLKQICLLTFVQVLIVQTDIAVLMERKQVHVLLCCAAAYIESGQLLKWQQSNIPGDKNNEISIASIFLI